MNPARWLRTLYRTLRLYRQEGMPAAMRNKKHTRAYTADFETTTDPDDCRVWAYAVAEIGNPDNFIYGNSLDDFMAWCEHAGNPVIYFHNLAFDGEFMLCWLFGHGYRHVPDDKDMEPNTFSTLIGRQSQFYTMTVSFAKKTRKPCTVTFYDSLKVLPMSVSKIAKGFRLPISKLTIDYSAYREPGHLLTPDEIDYIRNDVTIMAMALQRLFQQGLTKMTVGSNAFHDYKKEIPRHEWFHLYPVPDYDADIRQSYRGGFTYLKPEWAGRDVGSGIVLDVNSLYPYVMRSKLLPYGEGIYFDGKYQKDTLYRLCIQKLRCHFVLKPGYLPTIQIKRDLRFCPTEYITNSAGNDVVLCLTSVDLALFLEHYNVYNIEWLGGWKFKGKYDLFNDYIDKWSEIKIESKKADNGALYIMSKLMLNSLYGKFATNPIRQSKIPYDCKGTIHYSLAEPEMKDPVYIPIGTFITSYAREVTIRAAQLLYPRFIYADTDSLHLSGCEIPACLQVDKTVLGAWKHEFTFARARYLKPKTYIEDGWEPDAPDKRFMKVTAAGMPDSCHPHVTWENFRLGAKIPGKLKTFHVKGGVVLLPSPHTITVGIVDDGPQITLDEII